MGPRNPLRKLERLRRGRKLGPLPVGARILLFLVGWLLLLIGLAGLVLPGIQGVMTIFVGAALLSLVSELVYDGLRLLLSRWPKIWRRVEGLRIKVFRWIRRKRR